MRGRATKRNQFRFVPTELCTPFRHTGPSKGRCALRQFRWRDTGAATEEGAPALMAPTGILRRARDALVHSPDTRP